MVLFGVNFALLVVIKKPLFTRSLFPIVVVALGEPNTFRNILVNFGRSFLLQITKFEVALELLVENLTFSLEYRG